VTGLDEEDFVPLLTQGAPYELPTVLKSTSSIIIYKGELLKAIIGMPLPVDIECAVAD